MAEVDVGIGMYSTDDISIFEGYIKDCLNNNINCLRIDISNYNNLASIAVSKIAVLKAVSLGAKVVWGVSTNGLNPKITAANWNDYREGVLAVAHWAEDNGVYEFQLGNEVESQIDGTTLTMEQFIINLKALATEVKTIFKRGKISYSIGVEGYTPFLTIDKEDIDILALNLYRGSPTQTGWKTIISNYYDTFGSDGTYLTEMGLNGTSLANYSADEDIQASAILEMIEYCSYKGIKRVHYFNYIGDAFGVRNDNGTYKKILDILKITNDWKKRKTAGQSGLGGISHGKH